MIKQKQTVSLTPDLQAKRKGIISTLPNSPLKREGQMNSGPDDFHEKYKELRAKIYKKNSYAGLQPEVQKKLHHLGLTNAEQSIRI